MSRYSLPLETRFWHWVVKTDGCWLWTGALSHRGYGAIQLDDGRTRVSSHRASWLIHFGEVPEGQKVLHRCDVRHCVNPEHLFLGSPLENSRDMVAKGRSARGERNAQSRLTEEIVRELRRLAGEGKSYRELGSLFGISTSNAYYVARGKTWKHVT